MPATTAPASSCQPRFTLRGLLHPRNLTGTPSQCVQLAILLPLAVVTLIHHASRRTRLAIVRLQRVALQRQCQRCVMQAGWRGVVLVAEGAMNAGRQRHTRAPGAAVVVAIVVAATQRVHRHERHAGAAAWRQQVRCTAAGWADGNGAAGSGTRHHCTG